MSPATLLLRVVFVDHVDLDDGEALAGHDTVLAIDLEQFHRDLPDTGELVGVVLGEAEIVRHCLTPVVVGDQFPIRQAPVRSGPDDDYRQGKAATAAFSHGGPLATKSATA
jgi:hypothetical protein